MYKFILGILGAFGIIKKSLKYKKTDQKRFVRDLTTCSIILTREINKSIKEVGLWKWLGSCFSRAIQAVTNSPWSHSLIYLGKIKGKHIIIESKEVVCLNNLDDYLKKHIQLEVWSRSLTFSERRKIIKSAKAMLGSLYDMTEIFAHVFGTPQIESLVICSSFCKRGYEKVENIGGSMPSPVDLQFDFLRKSWWSRKRNNC